MLEETDADPVGQGADASASKTWDAHCTVPLTQGERSMLAWRAEKLGLTPEEWLRRVAAAAIRDDLFDAVVDEPAAE